MNNISSPRNRIIELIVQGIIPAEKTGEAVSSAKILPDGTAWRTFIDHLLLWTGAMALVFAVLFFTAYNWNAIGRFAKFGMVEAAIVLAVAAYWKLGARMMAGKVALLAATILLGVLLGLYGQTYQTGADPWQLFGNWALLMLPWAFIGRFAAIWVVWVVLINLTVVLYFQTFRSVFGLMLGPETGMLWLLFAFNTLAWMVWEYGAGKRRWLAERWAIRLLAVGSGLAVTGLVLHSIFIEAGARALPVLVWAAGMAGLYLVYRKIIPDLFMLAVGCLSGIVVLVTFLARHLLNLNAARCFGPASSRGRLPKPIGRPRPGLSKPSWPSPVGWRQYSCWGLLLWDFNLS